MDHIFNIAIPVEDERIVAYVEQQAEKQIIDDLRKDVEMALFERRNKSYWSQNEKTLNELQRQRCGKTDYFKDIIRSYLDELKPIIIDAAAKELAVRILRSKAGKELLENVAKESRGSEQE